MASKTLIPVEAYLKMSFDGPEPEYLDGEIKERHLGSTSHFEAQERMLEFFRSLKQSYSRLTYPEVTLRISPSRYRIADVAAFEAKPREKFPSTPPHVTVEIVSEDDRYVDINDKLAEYRAWGVKHVWLVDPWSRELLVYDDAGLLKVPAFELPEYGVKLSAAELFAD